MMQQMATKKPLVLVFAFAAMTGCAHHVETRVTSEGSTAITAATIMRNDDSAAAPSEAQKLVSEALVAKGYRIADSAVYHLEVAWSARPASLAISTKKGVADIAEGAKSGGCKATEYRLGVTLTKIADGQQDYHAVASEHHCQMPVTQVLPILVAAATADVGAPRGAYKIKRKL